jgi:hypothetical protein
MAHKSGVKQTDFMCHFSLIIKKFVKILNRGENYFLFILDLSSIIVLKGFDLGRLLHYNRALSNLATPF